VVQVSGTPSSRRVWQERCVAHPAGRHLRIWIGHLPGMWAGSWALTVLMHAFSRSSRVKPRSAVCRYRPWDTLCFAESGRPSQRTPRLLVFPIRSGRLPNTAGMVRWNYDRRLGKLWHTSGKRRPAGKVSCHLPPRSMVTLPAPRKRQIRKNTVSSNFDPPLILSIEQRTDGIFQRSPSVTRSQIAFGPFA